MENTTMTKTQHAPRITSKTAQFPYTIESWKPSDAHALYQLEKICWCPWIQKAEKDFLTIATKYPQLQRLIRNKNGKVIAAMSVNRINWNGKTESLPTWDQIAGGSIYTSDFSTTYTPNGNTLCLMSMNVSPNLQGIGLAQRLIEELKMTSAKLGVLHIISSLRPLDYGNYKLAQLKKNEEFLTFDEYCNLKNEKGEPYDRWLRSAFHQGMKPLRVSKNAIVIPVSKKALLNFKATYHPKKWVKVSNSQWECGETGSWYIDQNTVIYREDNLSVELPFSNY